MSRTAPPLTLRDLAAVPVTELKGVGASLAERLAQLEIESVLDLLQHYPRRYVDRSRKADIAELGVGEEATVFGEVVRIGGRRTKQRRTLVEAVVSDGTSQLSATFFNQPWREKQLSRGTEVALFGKLDVYRGRRQMVNPVVDVLGKPGGQLGDPGRGDGEADVTGRIVAVYPQSGKAEVFTWQLRRLVDEALRRSAPRGLADPLPEPLRDALDLVSRGDAYHWIHRPDTDAERRAAVGRLVFDEFLRMQVGLVARKRALEANLEGIEHAVDGPLVGRFHERLPFPLTGDQVRAIDEIVADMARPLPMHRLLQGDVGSGKTVVAVSALLVAVQGGYQGAFMAPTEVLAEQHFLTTQRVVEGLVTGSGESLFEERPVTVALLTNKTPAAKRRAIQAGLAQREIDIVIGTHALLFGDAEFTNLGLAVIDEQHRFGVEQRALLRDKGGARVPDVLVMTATPIPRTAAMLVYGDLDKSELREMPPGRTPIATNVIGDDPLGRAAAFEAVRAEVSAGRQAYVVCPLVEGSAKIEARAATEELERLGNEELAGLRLGLLHGQMPSDDKERTMAAFRDGSIDVLVATTVIEVGVDVPNATVMIVMDADRFGLSQLHQLRGRIGRGVGESRCYLFADARTPDAEARLEAMERSTDGFLLAETDLEIRGAGEVFGERQSGFSDLKLGRIPRDEPVVLRAREVAEQILDDDPELARHHALREEVEDLLGDDVEFLFKS